VAVRHRRDQALVRGAAAIAACHVGRGAGLVQEDEARRVHEALPGTPAPALGGDAGSGIGASAVKAALAAGDRVVAIARAPTS
jgi:hypothetical protein